MAAGLIRRSELQGIAGAIRAKTGSAETYKPREMAAAIARIGGRCPHADVLGTYTLDALPMTWPVTAVEQE